MGSQRVRHDLATEQQEQKLRVMFYSADILRSSSPGDRSARLLWGTSPKRQGRSQDTKRISQGIKRLLLIKENQTYQVKEFSTFLCMRRCKVWAYWNYPFDRHLSYLGPVSCVFSFWVPSGLTTGMAITRWLNGCSTLFFFFFYWWHTVFFIHKY